MSYTGVHGPFRAAERFLRSFTRIRIRKIKPVIFMHEANRYYTNSTTRVNVMSQTVISGTVITVNQDVIDFSSSLKRLSFGDCHREVIETIALSRVTR